MVSYKLTFKQSVVKDLRNIPKTDIRRILKYINVLCDNPRAEGCIKLSGQERYRVRQGVYRIVYEIRETELVIMIV